MPTKQKVRLSDIAEATGFSLSTVSKALNDRSDVSTETKSIIEEVMLNKGYIRRNNTTPGKEHNGGKNATTPRLIEVIFQDFETIWALEVLRGVVHEAKQHDISVITTEIGKESGSEWLDGIIQRNPLGIILIFSSLTEEQKATLREHGIDYVNFDPSGEPSLTDHSVQADNWTGGVLATRHLLALGHKRVGIITGPENMMCSRARLDGYCAALAERDIPVENDLITEGDFTTAGGYAQAMELLSNPDPPTAIFAGSDLQAMGVYEAARQHGLRIPEDLSVVGFDDVQTAAYLGPPLTTVRQPLQDMASAAARMLIDTAEGKKVQGHVILPTSLVVRGSTKKLGRPPL